NARVVLCRMLLLGIILEDGIREGRALDGIHAGTCAAGGYGVSRNGFTPGRYNAGYACGLPYKKKVDRLLGSYPCPRVRLRLRAGSCRRLVDEPREDSRAWGKQIFLRNRLPHRLFGGEVRRSQGARR